LASAAAAAPNSAHYLTDPFASMGSSSARLCCWLVCLTAIAAGYARAQAQPADQRLDEFVKLSQFGSPYNSDLQIPEQWCYYTKVDHGYRWWYLADAVSGAFSAVQMGNGFAIPFIFSTYGTRRKGSIVVGYAIDGGAPKAALTKVSIANSTPCRMGTEILTRGPYPIAGIAADLAVLTMVDPAPEYRYWPLLGRFHGVRSILAIPASFQVGSDEVAGRIIIAFSAD
jgi:hypothetical protein